MDPKHWAVQQRKEVMILTTPSELRMIADKMDKWWEVCEMNDSTTIHTYFGDKIFINICADQIKLSEGG